MVSSEVQRTLVKSPPELWAEISDPESLARHLGEFGEIRITHVHPEQRVEWEADDARGAVVIKPSGWGTKVKLTVTRELVLEPAEEDATDVTPEPDDAATVEPASAVERAPEIAASEPEPTEALAPPEPDVTQLHDANAELEPAHASATALADDDAADEAELAIESPEPEAELEQPEPQPRRGFLARLFGRRREAPPGPPAESGSAPEQRADPETTDPESAVEPEPMPESDTDAPADADAEPTRPAYEPTLTAEPDPQPHAEDASATAIEPAATVSGAEAEPASNPADKSDLDLHAPSATVERDEADEQAPHGDLAAELAAAEEVAAEQVTALLSGVLDRLGAAHHRPFSRS